MLGANLDLRNIWGVSTNRDSVVIPFAAKVWKLGKLCGVWWSWLVPKSLITDVVLFSQAGRRRFACSRMLGPQT
jgi:hypothetical protein